MKMHPYPVAVAILLALAACRPGAAEYTESEAPKQIKLDDASARAEFRFAAGSARLLAGDAERLRAMAASGRIVASDRVTVAVSRGANLAESRVNTISAELLRYGIVASAAPLAAAPANRAIVEVSRYLVTLPPCPNWSKDAAVDFTNALGSNFGCATAINLGRMAASPSDLDSGRPVGPAAGTPAVAAVQRYLTDKVQLPSSTNVGPIAAATTAAPGGAGGGAGSSPAGSQ